MEIREVLEEDIGIFYEIQSDPEGIAMAAFTPRRDKKAHIAHWKNNILADDTSFARTITADGVVVGNVVSWLQQGRRLVGYWVSRDHWGKGIATEALTQALKELPRPLFAYVAEHNIGSIRVLRKCGFQSSADYPPRMDDDVVELTMVLK